MIDRKEVFKASYWTQKAIDEMDGSQKLNPEIDKKFFTTGITHLLLAEQRDFLNELERVNAFGVSLDVASSLPTNLALKEKSKEIEDNLNVLEKTVLGFFSPSTEI